MRYRLPHVPTSKTAQYWLMGVAVVVMVAVNAVVIFRTTDSVAPVGTSSSATAARPSVAPTEEAKATSPKEPQADSPAGTEVTRTTPESSTTPTAVSAPKPSLAPTAPSVAPPAPVPTPFGMYSVSVSGMYACDGGGTSYFHISDANLIFKGTAGGTVKYWLESSGLAGIGAAGGVRTVSVPAGRSLGSLWQLSGAAGPPTLYAFAISPEQGEGSLRLIVQAGSDTQYSTTIAIPATSPC
ncbi:hypothetical protein EYC59_01345 [Candidatus Saccharibacteria bacterium]|nr:MAG: hypothetical protein EYC59_01345 [Candidatus Saccharibacteria bacterium]